MSDERPPPSPKPPRKYPDLHDRMEALSILAEIRMSRIEMQQAEIERLRDLLWLSLDMIRLIREGKPVPVNYLEDRIRAEIDGALSGRNLQGGTEP